jgi:hypothetical protein
MQLPERDRHKASRPHGGHSAVPITYTLNDAATVSGLSRSTLYRHAAASRLLLVKVGGRTLVNAVSLHTLLGVED